MTGVHDRFIRNQALQNRSQTENQIVANLQETTGVRVSGQTIRNRLHATHLHTQMSPFGLTRQAWSGLAKEN